MIRLSLITYSCRSLLVAVDNFNYTPALCYPGISASSNPLSIFKNHNPMMFREKMYTLYTKCKQHVADYKMTTQLQ